jgi:hypothetical protein
MYCSEFLEVYSDYRDGLIADSGLERDVRQHLRHCPRCMHYDALIARGVMALKATSDIEPAARPPHDPAVRSLQYTGQTEAAEVVRPAHAGLMVALIVLTAVATVIWAKTDKEDDVVASAPQAQHETTPVSIEPEGPLFETLVDLNEWSVPAFSHRTPTYPAKAVSFQTWVSSAR